MKPLIRTLLFFIPLILIGFPSLSQSRDFRTRELYFKKLYDQATDTPEDKNERRDSLFTQFGEEFIRFIKNNPGTIDYPFKDLSSILIQSSDDKVLRIYSWDDGSGGTMRFFNQIIQYRSAGKVYTHTPKRIQEGDPGEYCSHIFHLKAGTRNLYLPINNIIASTKDRAESISCLTIENNILTDTARIFKTRTKFLNRIELGYDAFSLDNHAGGPIELVKTDEKNILLKIAIVNKSNALTKNNLVYRFNGR